MSTWGQSLCSYNQAGGAAQKRSSINMKYEHHLWYYFSDTLFGHLYEGLIFFSAGEKPTTQR